MLKRKSIKPNRIASVGDAEIEMKWVSKYSRLPQKDYKTQQNWEGKVIHRELCNRLSFDDTN